jgi:Tol biopolymer transport system component
MTGGKGNNGGSGGTGSPGGGADSGGTGATGGTATGGGCNFELHDRFIVFDSDLGGLYRDVLLMRADGSEVWNITQTRDRDESDPEFSPNGAELAYVMDRADIETLDVESGEVWPVTPGEQPSYSPDGTEIAFHRHANVYRVRPDSEPVLVLAGLDDLNAYARPVYTPDGESLVMDRGNEITTVLLAGGGQRYVVQNWTTQMSGPDVSPDGTFVVASIHCDAHPSLWVSPFAVNTIPCEGRGLTSSLGVAADLPSWGPDNLVAYVEGTDPSDIAIVSADSRERCVIPMPGNESNPSWVPEGFVDPGWFEPL